MRVAVAAMAVLFVALPGVHVAAADPSAVVEEFSVETVDGTIVEGQLAYPSIGTPTDLVVMVHGYGNTVEGAWLGHMAEVAESGAVVVAVNFRDNLGFPVLRGAHDTNSAALKVLDDPRFPAIDRVVIFGVSMGGAISGTAIAEAPERAPGVPLYDHWVDVEGVSNLFETYYEATGTGHDAGPQIERETGGTADEVPEEYVRRSPALRAQDMDLQSAVLVHALNDGTVPYDQGRELHAALLAQGIPTRFTTVLREDPAHTEGTTGTYQIANLAGQDDPSETTGLHLAGHAWEGDRDSKVMSAGFDALYDILASESGNLGERVSDHGADVSFTAGV